MLHDQMIIVLATIVPLLLINSVDLVRSSFGSAHAMARGVARRARHRAR